MSSGLVSMQSILSLTNIGAIFTAISRILHMFSFYVVENMVSLGGFVLTYLTSKLRRRYFHKIVCYFHHS